MKKKLGFLIVLLALIGFIAPFMIQGRPHNAGALDGPNETTITLVQTRTIGQPTVRTWFFNGRFIDSGSWSFLGFHDSGSIFRSPVVGAAQVTLLLVGQNGTITVEQDDLINLQWLVDPFDVPEAGSWHIVSGTGAYATFMARGVMKLTFTVTQIHVRSLGSWRATRHSANLEMSIFQPSN